MANPVESLQSAESHPISAPSVIQLRDAVPRFFNKLRPGDLDSASFEISGVLIHTPGPINGDTEFSAHKGAKRDLFVVPSINRGELSLVNHHLYTFQSRPSSRTYVMADSPTWARFGSVQGEVEGLGQPFIDAYIIHEGGLATLGEAAAAHVQILAEGGELRAADQAVATVDTLLPGSFLHVSGASRVYLPSGFGGATVQLPPEDVDEGAFVYIHEKFRSKGKIPPHVVYLMSDMYEIDNPLFRGQIGFDGNMNKHVLIFAMAPTGGWELVMGGLATNEEEIARRAEPIQECVGSYAELERLDRLAKKQEAAEAQKNNPENHKKRLLM